MNKPGAVEQQVMGRRVPKTPPGWPAGLPPPELSGKLPLSVPLPIGATTDIDNRPGFDRFSWQSFIALNWPAGMDRGVPLDPNDQRALQRAGLATVWSTYKESYELFSQKEQRPAPWSSTGVPIKPCRAASSASMTVPFMAMPAKGGTLLGEINQAFSFPLIDQQHNYAWSEVRYNKAQYEFIRGEDGDEKSWLYLVRNLFAAQQKAGTKGLQMPASSAPDTQGALMIKATWRILGADADTRRYYTVPAQLYDGSETCKTQTMGLVGLHIVQKLDEFPQWIWSSFEQVDNVVVGPGAPAGLTPSFNNGTDTPVTANGFANRPQKVPPVLPSDQLKSVQVTRLNKIPTTPDRASAADGRSTLDGPSTVEMNRIYQQLLAGTVWRHYQLVITQWPTDGETFVLSGDGGNYPRDSGGAFPVKGCTNVVMETYLQADDLTGGEGNSCMECHYGASMSDFSMVLQHRAH